LSDLECVLLELELEAEVEVDVDVEEVAAGLF
jgi:hypothetical protein